MAEQRGTCELCVRVGAVPRGRSPAAITNRLRTFRGNSRGTVGHSVVVAPGRLRRQGSSRSTASLPAALPGALSAVRLHLDILSDAVRRGERCCAFAAGVEEIDNPPRASPGHHATCVFSRTRRRHGRVGDTAARAGRRGSAAARPPAPVRSPPTGRSGRASPATAIRRSASGHLRTPRRRGTHAPRCAGTCAGGSSR